MIDNLTGFFTTALWFLLAICILVPIHEWGHYYAMRRFGVKVLRFSVGFGKRLFTWTDKHGCEFAFSAIPLGGYVKPLDERSEEVLPEELDQALNQKPVWQRIIIFAAGPVANLVLAVLFYWLIFWIKGTVAYAPVVGKVEPGSIAEQAGLVAGQEIVAIDDVVTPTRRDVAIYLLSRLGERGEIRFTTVYPDSSLRYETAAELNGWLRDVEAPDPIGGLGLSFYRPEVTTEVGTVQKGSAAERAGLEVGDVVVSANGQALAGWDAWVKQVQSSPKTAMTLEVNRDGRIIPLDMTPEARKLADGTEYGFAGVGGVAPEWPDSMRRVLRYGPIESLSAGAAEMWETSGVVLMSMRKLIFGEISTKNLSGPIGIAKVAASHAEHGFWAFISFLAHLSILLGVLNLLPIPMLDGGHIVFALIEWVKGSPVSQEVQAWSVNLGIAMLFCVMVVAFYNDILRL